MDDQHVLALVEAVDGADFNAVGIFAFDTGFSDDVSHPALRIRLRTKAAKRIRFPGFA
jgi:hypothetical protein